MMGTAGVSQVVDYRAYELDAKGHVKRRIDFEADDDAAALQHARQYVDGHDVEVWMRDRVVGKLPHKA
jgi:hypothetical protein